MSSTPEGRITKKIYDYLKKRETAGEPIFFFKVHGSCFQKAGVPDWHVLLAGRAFYVEIKAPGKKPTRLQEYTMKKIQHAGGVVGVADSLEIFVRILLTEKMG